MAHHNQNLHHRISSLLTSSIRHRDRKEVRFTSHATGTVHYLGAYHMPQAQAKAVVFERRRNHEETREGYKEQ